MKSPDPLARFPYRPGFAPFHTTSRSFLLAPPDDTGTPPEEPPASEPLVPEDLTAVEPKTLAKFKADLQRRFKSLQAKPLSEDSVAEMREITEAFKKVDAEVTSRAEQAAAWETEAAELAGQIAEPTEEESPEEEPPEETPAPEASAPTKVPAKKPAPVGQPPAPEAVAASAAPVRVRPRVPSAAEMSRQPARPEQLPQARPEHGAVTAITAGGDLQDWSAGQSLSIEDVGKAFAKKAEALKNATNIGGQMTVATFHTQYPEDRLLSASDWRENERKIQAVIPQEAGGALVASGGICAPVGADYTIEATAVSSRPVRDSLARFGAEADARGGVRYVMPPKLSDTAAGVGVWTETTDANPGGATKAIVTMACASDEVALVDAISLSIKIGNFQARFFPEQFRAFYTEAQGQHARVAEGKLLDEISAGSTAVTHTGVLGFARDTLTVLDKAAAGMRNRMRTDDALPITVLGPAWARNAIRSDLTMQPDYGPPGLNAPGLAEIAGFFADRNLSPNWYLDTESGSGQIFPAQAPGPVVHWPSTAVFYLFVPGTWLLVDGGTLDFGVEIIDSVLIAKNNRMSFMETFEKAAFRGIESLRLEVSVCVTGASSLPIEVGCPAS